MTIYCVCCVSQMLEELGLDATDLVDDGMLSIFNAEDSGELK